MKLALALVAALSLAACVDEPTDPAAGLYGAGIGKAIETDPSQLVSATEVANQKFNGRDPSDFNQMVQEANRIDEFTGTNWDEVCGAPCKVIGLHMNNGDTFTYRDDGRFLGLIHAADINANLGDGKVLDVPHANDINANLGDGRVMSVPHANDINAKL